MDKPVTRDTYKSKTYAAENELRFIAKTGVTEIDFYGTTLQLPEPRKFGDLAGVQRFVDAVCVMPQVREKYGDHAPKVRARNGDRFAHYESWSNVIAVPDHQGSRSSWAMNEIVVLHELAHCLSESRRDPTGTHGTEFCLCFIFLLKTVLGGGWYLLLMRALDDKGVPLHASCNH